MVPVLPSCRTRTPCTPSSSVTRPDGARVVEDGDAVLLGGPGQRRDEARPAAVALDGEAAPELEPAVDLERLSSPDRREAHALGAHPAQRLAAPLDENLDEIGVGAILGDAIHVVEELVLGVGAEVRLRDLVRGEVRHQRLEVVDAVVDATHGARGEAAVASRLLARRAFEHEHGHAMLPGCKRRTQGGVASAHHHYICRGWKHSRCAPDASRRSNAGETTRERRRISRRVSGTPALPLSRGSRGAILLGAGLAAEQE